MEDNRLKTGALSWLYEMEVLNSPTLQQNLQENILLSDFRIKSCEILLLKDFKDILIYIELGFFNRIFRGSTICIEVASLIKRMLPSYRVRVITDRKIFELSLTKVKEYYGGFDENSNNSTHDESKQSSNSEDQLPEASNLLPDQEEQTINKESTSDEVEQSDLSDEQKTQDPS